MKKINLCMVLALIFSSTLLLAQPYEANNESSTLKWTGQKVTGKHHGTINLRSGKFTIENNKFSSGNFIIDMTSIKNTDIENEEYNKKFVDHLKSADFFDTNTYPTASFQVTGASKMQGGNSTVTGDLTIKGITHPVEFKAILHHTDNGMKVYGNLVIDRTKYNVRYGSGKFFDNLADNTIYDEFTINLDILAEKE